MIAHFTFWTSNPFHPTVRYKEKFDSWPITTQDPCDEVSGFARDWAMRWREDPDFPDHPFRDKTGNVVLPSSLDMTPADYVDANEPPARAPEPRPVMPMAGPMNIVRAPGAAPTGMQAAYEASRRDLKRLDATPPAPAYEPPADEVSGFTPPFIPNDPAIPPRIYEADPDHPKYGRHTGHLAGRR